MIYASLTKAQRRALAGLLYRNDAGEPSALFRDASVATKNTLDRMGLIEFTGRDGWHHTEAGIAALAEFWGEK